ncbi:MAG: helicase-related protein [Ginsengibacter sp.]
MYTNWVNNKENNAKVTGIKAVDIRHALVDAFKSDQYDIMVATEAAAEGINLQFCSMIVNYDLPWNPQRVEQRIGRCHRYGQEFDVVVVNFLNAANDVEARVYELLEHKYQLFEGVFGSSDHVLGAIESGLDFEKRIVEIYKKCRTKEQIAEYFDALYKAFEDEIDEKMKTVQSTLFENFEASVINKLRITMSETKTFIEKYEKWLWELTRYYFGDRITYFEEDYSFVMDDGEIYSLNKKREDAKHFRLQSKVAQNLIEKGKKEKTEPAKLLFSFSGTGIKYKDIELLKSKKGLLKVSNLMVDSEIETHSVLLFSGITEEDEHLNDELCRFILSLHSTVEANSLTGKELNCIEKVYLKNKTKRLAHLEDTDSALLQREFRKFNHWADDRIQLLEEDLKDARREERELNNASLKDGLSSSEVLDFQTQIAKIKRKVNRLRNLMFERQDEIEEQRDLMIQEAKQKITRTIHEEEIFTIAFEII